MKLNYYKLISDEEYMPKLKVLNSIEYSGDRWELTDIYELAPVFSELTDVRREFAENVYMVTYGYDNNINGIHHISTGHLTRAEIPIRIIITHIVLSNAYGFKIFHNHPFDDVNDSEENIVQALDNVIVNFGLDREKLRQMIDSKNSEDKKYWTLLVKLIDGELKSM